MIFSNPSNINPTQSILTQVTLIKHDKISYRELLFINFYPQFSYASDTYCGMNTLTKRITYCGYAGRCRAVAKFQSKCMNFEQKNKDLKKYISTLYFFSVVFPS